MIAAGCKSKKEGPDAIADAVVSVSQKSFGDIDNVLKAPKRKVSDAQAETVLKSMGIWEQSDWLTWDARSGDQGNYSFKNVVIKSGEGEDITAGKLELSGLHMVGDVPVADVLTFTDLKMTDDEFAMTVDSFAVKSVFMPEALNSIEDVANFDLEPNQLPQAIVVKGFSGGDDEVSIKIKTLGVGEDNDDNHLRFAAEDIDITSKGKEAFTVKLAAAHFKSLEALKPGTLEALADVDNPGALLDFTNSMQFGDMLFTDLIVNSDYFDLSLPKYVQSAQKSGDITHVRMGMPSLKMDIKEAAALDPQSRQAMQMLKSLDFTSMEFSSAGYTEVNLSEDIMDVKEASLNLKDGFDLNYTAKFSGYQAMNKASVTATTPSDIAAAQENFEIHNFALSLEDKSIVDRSFKLAGEMTGQSPENLRRQLNGVMAIGTLAATAQGYGEIYGDFTSAFGDFIEKGGTLNIAMNPETPISLGLMKEIERGEIPDVKQFGLSTSNTPPAE